MGHGASHLLKLNTKDWMHVTYNGRNLVNTDFEENIISWNCEHDIDGKSNLRPDVFKYSVKIESLTQDDRDYLKKDGWVKGDEGTADLEKQFSDYFWSGYCRSSLKDTFPITLESEIYIHGFGHKKVYITISPKNWDDIKSLFADMMDSFVSDEDIKAYAKEEEVSESQAQEILYDERSDDFDSNWKVKAK